MSDLRQLAIAAISESGNKSPRLAALLMKLAACVACTDNDPDVDFLATLGTVLATPFTNGTGAYTTVISQIINTTVLQDRINVWSSIAGVSGGAGAFSA